MILIVGFQDRIIYNLKKAIFKEKDFCEVYCEAHFFMLTKFLKYDVFVDFRFNCKS